MRESSWWDDTRIELSVTPDAVELATPGCVVFQLDNRVLLRFGERLLYVAGERPLKGADLVCFAELAERLLARARAAVELILATEGVACA